MSEFASVLELAQAVTREANLISEGEEGRLKAELVQMRVSEVTAALTKLTQAVTAARRLAKESGEAAVNLTGLNDGLKNFSGYVSRDGLPSNLAFNSARGKIESVTKRVSAELAEAWTSWVKREMAAIPRNRIDLLDQADKKAANEKWADLSKTAKVPSPSVTDIIALKSGLGYFRELLKDVEDPTGLIAALLPRLDRPRGVTLAELTDEDITALRDFGIAGQIEVRRRNG
jgi:hypothetical protein